ncbi:GspE/PulE family protein [Desulfovermiculus halophilus]|uniref:GspE/PulE family protein n=1 Tax=Desulfovermiculus halophilus TaxID=339722 RepID=UPI00047F6662|nr:ATPase, T2SS/T4P/T4SS family [Desulfovermiculus halophilus]
MRQAPRLGELLVQKGLLTTNQLQDALTEKKKYGLKLGEYLIRENIVREQDVIEVISKQLDIRRFRFDQYQLDQNLTSLIPYTEAKEHSMVPVQKKGNVLYLAMTDPLDINAFDQAEILTNLDVEPLICSESEMQSLLSAVYGEGSDSLRVMEEFEGLEADEDSQEQDSGLFTPGEIEVSALRDMAQEAPVIRLVNSLLAQAIREKASDVHLSPEKKQVQLRFRIDGVLQDKPAPPKSMFLPVVSRLKILANMDIASSLVPQDGRFTVTMQGKEINVRASSLPTIHGENLVLRLLDMSAGVMNLEDLGMDQALQDMLNGSITKPYGMILSTGPTGSGKSTSLYSIIKSVNTPDVNIITLEDPVEYRVSRVRQVQLNRRAGMTFASGLRSIMRQDPDVIMVGEIRDLETATIAVQSALTGHRLLSTVHTNDAAGAITRLIDMGIEPFLVASSLLVSFAQRLVRRVCPACAEPYTPDRHLLKYWGLDERNDVTFMRGRGCFQCNQTGFKGRTGVFEILVNDEQVQDMILERKSGQRIARVLHQEGKLRTLKEDALDKVLRGLTTLEEATSKVMV